MAQLPHIEGRFDVITVEFEGLSCLECPQGGHLRLYPYWAYSEEEFYKTIISWFTKDGPLIWPKHAKASSSWFGLRTTYSCFQCGARLEGKGYKIAAVRGEVEPGEIPPISIVVRIPLARCQACNQEQLLEEPTNEDSQAHDAIKQAILDALNNAKMQP
jgi:hypothetical protein